MDPNATLELWRSAKNAYERDEARFYLVDWLSKGGFWPNGMTSAELAIFWELYELQPPKDYPANG